jgi:hypothetical protein
MKRLKKIFFLCFTFIILSNIAYAAVLETTDNTAEAVNIAIGLASDGDTINVIAGDGKADWGANAVTIPNDKALAIIGPGKANLTINLTGNYAFTIMGSASRISGFTFVSPSNSKYTAINAKGQGWRVDHCGYNSIVNSDTVGTASFVFANDLDVSYGAPSGLVDNNTIITGKILIAGGSTFTEMGTIFSSALNLGSDDTVYIEDNVFTTTIDPDTIISLAVDAVYAGSYVFRYNTLVHYDVLTHGLQEYSTRGTRKWEIYGNSFEAKGTAANTMINMKAGTGVIFYNLEVSVSPNDFTYFITLQHERDVDKNQYGAFDDCDGSESCDGNEVGKSGWLCRDQVGAGTDAAAWTNPVEAGPAQGKTPAYFWVNKDTDGNWPDVYNPNDTHIKENRDFYNFDSSFDGSSGCGCGTLANRPATCTVGTAYWVTNQSCSNLTGMVGANPTTPISGTLYKCTAPNTWTEYYKPYTYPHPLRTEESTNPPEKPQNLRIIN